jgi:hypothetical protein
MFSRARATMAMPKLFKTSQNGRSKHLYLEGADLRHNPILVAHNEYKIASTGSVMEIEYPDVVLSLGTGHPATSSQNSKESETRKYQDSAETCKGRNLCLAGTR